MNLINTALRSAKGLAYSEMENKIREATNNDPWGPSGSQMLEICGFTYCRGEAYADPLALLWRRLMTPEQPRHTQKALILVDFLLRHGSENFIDDCKRSAGDIRTLTHYTFVNPKTGEEQGNEVRKRAEIVYSLLSDDKVLAEARISAEKNLKENKFKGYSSDNFATRYDPGQSRMTGMGSGVSSTSHHHASGSYEAKKVQGDDLADLETFTSTRTSTPPLSRPKGVTTNTNTTSGGNKQEGRRPTVTTTSAPTRSPAKPISSTTTAVSGNSFVDDPFAEVTSHSHGNKDIDPFDEPTPTTNVDPFTQDPFFSSPAPASNTSTPVHSTTVVPPSRSANTTPTLETQHHHHHHSSTSNASVLVSKPVAPEGKNRRRSTVTADKRPTNIADLTGGLADLFVTGPSNNTTPSTTPSSSSSSSSSSSATSSLDKLFESASTSKPTPSQQVDVFASLSGGVTSTPQTTLPSATGPTVSMIGGSAGMGGYNQMGMNTGMGMNPMSMGPNMMMGGMNQMGMNMNQMGMNTMGMNTMGMNPMNPMMMGGTMGGMGGMGMMGSMSASTTNRNPTYDPFSGLSLAGGSSTVTKPTSSGTDKAFDGLDDLIK